MSSQSTHRELLMAENIGWWYDAWVGNLFQECPWKDPAFISFAAELNRDSNHHPTSHVQSWAPAGLIPVKMLIANDAESVLHALAELKRCEVDVARLQSVLRELKDQKRQEQAEQKQQEPAEPRQWEDEEFRFFRSDELSVHRSRSFSEDLPDLLEVDRYAPLLFVRRIYYDQHHHPVLAQELWSPVDKKVFVGRLVLPDPDDFEMAAARIRELPYWSKPGISEDAFIPWSNDWSNDATAHKEVTP